MADITITLTVDTVNIPPQSGGKNVDQYCKLSQTGGIFKPEERESIVEVGDTVTWIGVTNIPDNNQPIPMNVDITVIEVIADLKKAFGDPLNSQGETGKTVTRTADKHTILTHEYTIWFKINDKDYRYDPKIRVKHSSGSSTDT